MHGDGFYYILSYKVNALADFAFFCFRLNDIVFSDYQKCAINWQTQISKL